jgi:hypothetical protein
VKNPALGEISVVMAALDAAIHEKHNTFNILLDGRVKPGHDNGRSRYFIHSLEGGDPWQRRTGF